MTGDFPRHSAVIVSESAEMGRKAKYLTESAKKKAKREKRTVGLQKSIYLGKVFSAWTDAKRTTEASSDRLDEILLTAKIVAACLYWHLAAITWSFTRRQN